MSPLGQREYETFIAALRGDKFDRAVFTRATQKIRLGSGIRPEGLEFELHIPSTLREWKRDPQWAIQLVDRHQHACNASWLEYWRQMGEERELPARDHAIDLDSNPMIEAIRAELVDQIARIDALVSQSVKP